MGKSHKLTILIVDDNRVMREILRNMLIVSDHMVLSAEGHEQALAHLHDNQIDLILMDIEMPDVNGYELTKLIRQTFTEWIPIIFLSSNDTEEALAKGIDAGGDDYLTKPVKNIILNAKVRAMGRIAQMKNELDALNQTLEKLNTQDPLTKVLNRRALDKKLKDISHMREREAREHSILMIDIDYFKLYNDNYGHPAGDLCLKKFALILKQSVERDADVVARYGGEEFIILLPFTNVEGATKVAERIIQSLAKENILHEYSSAANFLTASIGISTAQQDKASEKLIKQADLALYNAKKNGRNQVSFFTENKNNSA